MSQEKRLIYVGMHDGVCSLSSDDGGETWQQGPITQLPHAAARVSVSPVDSRRAWLAAYEAGVYRTDDGGATWSHLASYPSGLCPQRSGRPGICGLGSRRQRTGRPVPLRRFRSVMGGMQELSGCSRVHQLGIPRAHP